MSNNKIRFAVDTGGTFTDLVIEDSNGQLAFFKAPTTPQDPVLGVLDVLELAAYQMGLTRKDLLTRGEHFIHGTTRAINAILTGNTAKTAFLTTKGHPDILVLREAGRSDPFNFTRPFPEPYVPRSLTFEVPERISSRGQVILPLDEKAVIGITKELTRRNIEAVAVCLLWSIVNPAHECRVGELLAAHMPGVPYTLSHELNPTIREYRRASSTCIDASLKPLMTSYLDSLESRLREEGFAGRVLMVSSGGGILDAAGVAKAPIHSISSGPSMAPVAGSYFARVDGDTDTALVADTGGTSYDVSLVRRGRIPQTRETWLGPRFLGHMTGFPSVDVKSIGAGGGSIAWIDDGGLLHVGPQSAGAEPGPVCYRRGGTRPTVTDACLALGYIDPNYFLGGAMKLDYEAACNAIREQVGDKLRRSVDEAAAAILALATEHMVSAIEDITVNQGIDPQTAVLIGGGGAAGLNAVTIARRLKCSKLIIPEAGAVLSAAGALMSDLTRDFAATFVTSTANFDYAAANRILADLTEKCRAFFAGPGAGSVDSQIELLAEARYPHQVWELEVPVRVAQFSSAADLEQLRQEFHTVHEEIFAIKDEQSPVEIVAWRARARSRVRDTQMLQSSFATMNELQDGQRQVYFSELGRVSAVVRRFEAMRPGERLVGPVIIESPFTTVVINPGALVERTRTGSLLICP